jgi:uncharacterized protein (TIGR02145 family)
MIHMKNIFRISGVILIVFSIHSCNKVQDDIIKDGDGNKYTSVQIGTQVWLVGNLKTTKYNDGTPIPNITDAAAWAAATTGAYSDYSNTPANSATYGRLYNWYVVDNNEVTRIASNGGKNVCPAGWHVPSDDEWRTLTTFLGGYGVAGDKLKETGTTHWITPNAGATNETGFTALPGGWRYSFITSSYNGIGKYGAWWSSTESYITSAWDRSLVCNDPVARYNSESKQSGHSVRCVRDF